MSDKENRRTDPMNFMRPDLSFLRDKFKNSRYHKIDKRFFDAVRKNTSTEEIWQLNNSKNYDDYYKANAALIWLEEVDGMSKMFKTRFENRFSIDLTTNCIGIKFSKMIPPYLVDFSSLLGAQVVVDLNPDEYNSKETYLIFDVIDASEAISCRLIGLSPAKQYSHYTPQQLRPMKIRHAYIAPSFELFDNCHKALNKIRNDENHELRRVLTAMLSNDSESVLKDYENNSALIDFEATNTSELENTLDTLDDEQGKAVRDILAAKFRPYPYVICGTQGSGKTETLIEAIYQVYKRSNGLKKILVCATFESYLRRLYDRVVSDGRISDNAIEQLMRVRKGDREVSLNLSIYFATTVNLASFPDEYFDYIFLDKASATHQPETLVVWCKLKSDGCFIMSGDPHQEHTQIRRRAPDEVRSLSMLQLFSYNDTQVIQDRRYITYLVRSYRSDPRILSFFNGEIYNEQMLLGNNKTPRSVLQKLGVSRPVILVDVRHRNQEKEHNRQLNVLVDACREHVERLIESGIKSKDIAIIAMTGFTMCRDNLRRSLEGEFDQCIINMDSEFTGIERHAIVIVLDPFRKQDKTETRYIYGGFYRLNKSMSRAKWIVTIIGDFSMLDDNSTWNELSKSSCTIRLD